MVSTFLAYLMVIMSNPIRNAIKPITKRDLVSCKRCGCPNLARVKYASGKWGLVETSVERPFWRGDGAAPEGLWALKFNYHNCEKYLADNKEAELRANACHPKAHNPAEILADSFSAVIANAVANGGLQQLTDESNPYHIATRIIMEAQQAANGKRDPVFDFLK